jgi:drug/metabolite transporter (DMT)-like permease
VLLIGTEPGFSPQCAPGPKAPDGRQSGAVKFRHFLQLVALSALWGTSFMLTRFAAPVLGPNMLAALRMGFATLALACIMRALRQRWPTEHWRELLLLAVLAVAGPHILFSWSALHMPAGYAALLYVTSVLFGAFASAWMKEEVLTGMKLFGCLLGFAGAALVVQLGPVQPSVTLVVAVLTATLGSALSGASTPLIKRAITRMEPLAITAGMHLISFLVLLPGALVDWPTSRFTASALGAVVVMGVATSGLAWWMYARLMRHVTPIAALSSTFMITGFGVLWAVVFLDEQVGVGHYTGGALILLASTMVMGFNPLRRPVPARASG